MKVGAYQTAPLWLHVFCMFSPFFLPLSFLFSHIESHVASPPHLFPLPCNNFPSPPPPELSDYVCLCLHLQEVRTEFWRASPSSSLHPSVPTTPPCACPSCFLRPPSLRLSRAPPPRLHRHPSGLIHNPRFSAGYKVSAERQQPLRPAGTSIPQSPSFPSQHALPLADPWHPGAGVCCRSLIGWQLKQQNGWKKPRNGPEFNYHPTAGC